MSRRNTKKRPTAYHAREFARHAGVTVRTLHHYDRLDLLKPRARSAAGYRLYGAPDFARLQQIVTLKFIGFPLRQIRQLLDGANLAVALRAQRKTLEQRRSQLDRAIRAIAEAENTLETRRSPDWDSFTKIIELIRMQTNDWTRKYYNDEAQKLISERQSLWSPELQRETEQKWSQLFADIEAAAAAHKDPRGPEGKALADRHAKLIEGFTGGHAAIEQGLGKLWADQEHWPEAFKKQVYEPFANQGNAAAKDSTPGFMSAEAQAFINEALACRKPAG